MGQEIFKLFSSYYIWEILMIVFSRHKITFIILVVMVAKIRLPFGRAKYRVCMGHGLASNKLQRLSDT